jgi:hypothetical protein
MPLFDTLDNVAITNHPTELIGVNLQDFTHAVSFLKSYKGSLGTFNAYRRKIERLLHWSWLLANKSVNYSDARRENDISYLTKELFYILTPATYSISQTHE